MPTVFTHVVSAVALGAIYSRPEKSSRFWVLAIFCAVVPDADVIGFALGIKYGDLLGHRGFSHSLCFALIAGLVVTTLAFKSIPRFSRPWWYLVLFFSCATASHGLLDALTNGGLGIAFFSPFDSTRYFLPWRPLQVSPIGLPAFLSFRGLDVLISEFVWIWIPAGFLALVVVGLRHLRNGRWLRVRRFSDK